LSHYAKRHLISFEFLDMTKFLNGAFPSQFVVVVFFGLTLFRALLLC
jgi:hypothetical protein